MIIHHWTFYALSLDRAEVCYKLCLVVRAAQNLFFRSLQLALFRLQEQDFYEEEKNARGNQVIGCGETSALAI
jgi:hypothetical protein